MIGNPAVFIDSTVEDQALELRSYFKSLGAEISEEKSPKGIEDDLYKIIGVCDTCFKDGQEQDVESVLNSIVSMFVTLQIPISRAENLILNFCDQVKKTSSFNLGHVGLKVLWLLFQSLSEDCTMRYHVYFYLIQIAHDTDQIKAVFKDVDHLKQQFAACPPSNEQMQKLLRALHDVLLKSKQGELAAKVMIELLGTYTSENASQAREDAQRCIFAALADPNTFLLEPLLSLKPVKFLEGELIHDLLSIFVYEKLPAYIKFYQEHKEFVNSLGLDHNQNLKKMKLLTFMQLAETEKEMSFDLIQSELQISENEVEAFIIDVLKTKFVHARMDQAARKVHISNTMHRTFGRAQWQQLRDVLYEWKDNLSTVQQKMKQVVNIPVDVM
ncbi:unnamed protein product [Bemisia tabaci]|uniref:Eukaryotic translation initiation factor 3 subunit M n=1 Tax=Bemisia tabaci TaxID=7038 RepID=A0A9P0F319_BEMTA|nr:PREDICTED: eukaryotic translation initiation factor 3 subunit M [Bemisia tabaci]CAH0389861.1 unnamed protein product [Bemisia tabaci]